MKFHGSILALILSISVFGQDPLGSGLLSQYASISETGHSFDRWEIHPWPNAGSGRSLALLSGYDCRALLWMGLGKDGGWTILDAWELRLADGQYLTPDFAPYHTQPGVTAIGLRLSTQRMLHGGGASYTVLFLFSTEGDRLTPILKTPMEASVLYTSGWSKEGVAEKVDEQVSATLKVGPRMTRGHFEMVKRVPGRKRAMHFRWDGEAYDCPSSEITVLKSWELGEPWAISEWVRSSLKPNVGQEP